MPGTCYAVPSGRGTTSVGIVTEIVKHFCLMFIVPKDPEAVALESLSVRAASTSVVLFNDELRAWAKIGVLPHFDAKEWPRPWFRPMFVDISGMRQLGPELDRTTGPLVTTGDWEKLPVLGFANSRSVEDRAERARFGSIEPRPEDEAIRARLMDESDPVKVFVAFPDASRGKSAVQKLRELGYRAAAPKKHGGGYEVVVTADEAKVEAAGDVATLEDQIDALVQPFDGKTTGHEISLM